MWKTTKSLLALVALDLLSWAVLAGVVYAAWIAILSFQPA